MRRRRVMRRRRAGNGLTAGDWLTAGKRVTGLPARAPVLPPARVGKAGTALPRAALPGAAAPRGVAAESRITVTGPCRGIALPAIGRARGRRAFRLRLLLPRRDGRLRACRSRGLLCPRPGARRPRPGARRGSLARGGTLARGGKRGLGRLPRQRGSGRHRLRRAADGDRARGAPMSRCGVHRGSRDGQEGGECHRGGDHARAEADLLEPGVNGGAQARLSVRSLVSAGVHSTGRYRYRRATAALP